jgi:hypothetical protein
MIRTVLDSLVYLPSREVVGMPAVAPFVCIEVYDPPTANR